MMYATVLFLHVYKHRRREIYDAYSENFWDGAKQTVASVFDAQATNWNEYEVIGLDKIPDKGAALLVYYHGALPIDMYYIIAKMLLYKKRSLKNVVATFLFRLPGFKILLDVFGASSPTRDECVKMLKRGELLALSPGGVREALFSDEHYQLVWNGRLGFAKVAHEAEVTIIPVFTQNVREMFRTIKMGRRILQLLYEFTRCPLAAPIYGGFPVKMRTYIGDPIPHDSRLTPEELSEKVQMAIKNLIKKHQRVPGSILLALADRFSRKKGV
ncbi:transmembrane protein 68-like isoform X2 [Xenia sp. Carnegie-2017]|uniref:transmembrane protein 68-like isoform X2 n=1 Tax=Xenia sp. Carnegie-2017 TaxID=2897299 RepID=UPI001F03BC25|nr:transmembrane protein 68-like isoform X2 [Xenia sp. Carnegie-2017]